MCDALSSGLPMYTPVNTTGTTRYGSMFTPVYTNADRCLVYVSRSESETFVGLSVTGGEIKRVAPRARRGDYLMAQFAKKHSVAVA